MSIADIKAAIRDIPDFPRPGILFKDITPVLRSPDLFAATVAHLAAPYREHVPDCIVGIESRGFIFGAAMAQLLGCGFVPLRKQGKLPCRTRAASYQLEYGSATIEIHEDALAPGEQVVLVDDLLATGGTAAAAISLIRELKAEIVGIEFVIELAFLGGRKHLVGSPVNALIVVN